MLNPGICTQNLFKKKRIQKWYGMVTNFGTSSCLVTQVHKISVIVVRHNSKNIVGSQVAPGWAESPKWGKFLLIWKSQLRTRPNSSSLSVETSSEPLETLSTISLHFWLLGCIEFEIELLHQGEFPPSRSYSEISAERREISASLLPSPNDLSLPIADWLDLIFTFFYSCQFCLERFNDQDVIVQATVWPNQWKHTSDDLHLN